MNKIWAKASEDEIESNNHRFPSTEWHSICIRQFVHIDGTYRFFFRHWEMHFFAPALLLIITAFVFTVFILTVFYYMSKTLKIVCLVEIIFFLAFFFINYFEAMCMDPGFLPYFWPAIKPSQRKFWYSWEEQLTYLAITPKQIEIASFPPFTTTISDNSNDINHDQLQPQTTNELNGNESQSQVSLQTPCNTKLDKSNQLDDDSILSYEENANNPSNTSTNQDSKQQTTNETSKLQFASFSRSAGRFVIRADHICGWIANWVGKRNHKHFILFTLYAGIFYISLLLWRIAPKQKNSIPLKNRSYTLYILDIVSVVLEVLLTVILFPFFINQIIQLSKGKTQLQLMKENRNYKNADNNKKSSCMHEMRQVCGDGNVFCWICPIPAFGKDLNIEDYL